MDRRDTTDQQTTTDEQERVPVERGDVRGAMPPDAVAMTQTGTIPSPTATQQPGTPATTTPPSRDDIELLPRDTLDDFRGRWERVQVMFVDQPRDAVQQAHDLVDQLVDRLTESFGKQREGLEGTWTRGEDVSTEDLRLALQRYRSFFDRLLST